MGKGSQGLLSLRPVTFRYKDDPQNVRHYGLIAEESHAYTPAWWVMAPTAR